MSMYRILKQSVVCRRVRIKNGDPLFLLRSFHWRVSALESAPLKWVFEAFTGILSGKLKLSSIPYLISYCIVQRYEIPLSVFLAIHHSFLTLLST